METKRRCAIQSPGESCAASRVFSHSAERINSRILTVSPVLHIAFFRSQPSSRDHGAFLGSRVSGSKARQIGSGTESFSHASGKRLLSEITASAGFATGVLPLLKRFFHP